MYGRNYAKGLKLTYCKTKMPACHSGWHFIVLYSMCFTPCFSMALLHPL
ncbi:MAG: hypothetical protein ACI815_000506 [Psychroserpens sp.]|jgi:hypothetical protein